MSCNDPNNDNRYDDSSVLLWLLMFFIAIVLIAILGVWTLPIGAMVLVGG
jgi:hypothetical protein